MGTTVEWIRVLERGALFAVLMFFANRPRSSKLSKTVVFALGGLLFGTFMVFEWRVFHGGIMVVFAMAVFGLLIARVVEWRNRKVAGTVGQ